MRKGDYKGNLKKPKHHWTHAARSATPPTQRGSREHLAAGRGTTKTSQQTGAATAQTLTNTIFRISSRVRRKEIRTNT